jgi:hypothetical protein
MKTMYAWTGLMAMAGALAGTAALAQQPAPNANTVTVSGCVQRATSTSNDTSSKSGAAMTNTRFVLASASARPGTTPAPTGTSGSTAIASEYRLDDANSDQIAAHVGHKVEITGTIEDRGTAATSAASAASSSPKLKVDSVKMIASSCSE